MSFRDNPGNGVVQQMVQLGLHRGEWRSHIYGHLSRDAEVQAAVQIEGARNIVSLLAQAEWARQYARSYRNFRVGAAALAAYSGGGHPLVIEALLGSNSKPVQGSDAINIHAEHELMIQAMERKLPGQVAHIPIFTVMGDLQPDQQTGNETPTLHPCGICRDSFMEPGSPISPESICVTARADYTEIEWFSVDALLAFHRGETDRSAFGHASFAATPLSLAAVLPQRGDASIDLVRYETDEFLQSDHEVAQKLQLPLMEYVADRVNKSET